ncbi:hypothetical protein L6164_002182 [Bauhinia variegata]|uniref:Uncharacterized protein n=1 Tax=Bauhinia variegata TaxID=167791 RepID=A0ACB9PXF3_BAUVA|nr:hypothetical protein L6164_002182 [Bauhinia variegata]
MTQQGCYKDALASHEIAPYHGPRKVEKWKSALRKAADLSGYHFNGEGLEYEYVFIKKIIEVVNTKINRIPLLKKVPTCILKLPKLEWLHLSKGAKLQFIRKFGEQGQVISSISTEKQICLGGCNFLDGFLPSFLGCFPNMTSLELQGSNLTILPECIQVCQHLSNLNLDNCKQLREIRAIPPKIEVLSARNCTSLMPSALNLLLDENIHSRGNTWFTLPGTRIPEWIDYYGKTSLSFWFRNKFPDVVQFVIGRPMFGSLSFKCSISVNGRVLDEWNHSYSELETGHTFLYNLRLHHDHDFEKYEMVYLEDEWNQAEISFVSKTFEVGRRKEPLVQEKGVYIFDRDRIGRDILFTNPNQYRNPKPMNKQLRWNYQILGLKCCLLLLRVMAIASGY